jgi:hypothetical protein
MLYDIYKEIIIYKKVKMGFEKFVLSGKSFRPKVSIRKSGMFGFNNALINKFNIKSYKFVILFFDKEKKIIGFKFSNNNEEEGIYKLSIREKSVSFSGKAFLDFYDIKVTNTKRFEANWDNKNEMLVIKI